VRIGALQRETCVLDTGASRTLISDRLRDRLGLTPVARAAVVSSAGSATHDVVRLPALAIGTVTHAGLFATVVPADRLRAITPRAACVIGHDFLSAQDYTIDYARNRLTWTHSSGGDGTSTRIPLMDVQGRYVAELPQSDDGAIAVRLVPDSGASDIVLFSQPSPPALPLLPLFVPAAGRLSAATGSRDVRAVRIERLVIGEIELRDRLAFLVSRSVDQRTGAEGLLPLHLFARVSFSAADRTMVLTPR
jgi:predicted aspartyl protease